MLRYVNFSIKIPKYIDGDFLYKKEKNFNIYIIIFDIMRRD